MSRREHLSRSLKKNSWLFDPTDPTVQTRSQQQRILLLITGGHGAAAGQDPAAASTKPTQPRCLHQVGPESSFAHSALHQIGKLFKHRAVAINDQLCNLTGDGSAVGVTGEVAAPDHRHPHRFFFLR